MTIVRHLAEGDRDRVAHLQKQAFVLPPERVAIAGNYPLEQGWVVEDGGTVQGALRVQKLQQFFGGRGVPCAAVSSVKVAAEARGRGYGGALLRQVLEALRSEGVAVSTLFPVHGGYTGASDGSSPSRTSAGPCSSPNWRGGRRRRRGWARAT